MGAVPFVNSEKDDNSRYILITENDGIFYVVANSYKHTFSEIPQRFIPYKNIISDGIRLYNNERSRRRAESGSLGEYDERLNKIIEKMKDRCKPSVKINSYEDAEKLFIGDKLNYNYISRRYNKNTVSDFDKYMPDEKMRAIRGKKYRALVSWILDYPKTLNEEDYKSISENFAEAGGLVECGIDDLYVKTSLDVIKKSYHSGVISCGYIGFIEKYIKNAILSFPDRIQELRPLLDFINENMRNEDFRSLDFYRKELEKHIYRNGEGFRFVFTTDELREIIFDFLKPEYRTRNDLDVMNINWTTGVYDKERGIFVTLIYYLSDGIARCDMEFRSYIVITDSGNVFKADNNYDFEKRSYHFGIPGQYEMLADKVKEGIEFYENGYTYRKSLSEEERKQLEAIDAEMDDRCHKSFPISCEKDAQRLFELANYNTYVIYSEYNKKTIRDFNKFADDNKMRLWRGNKYLQLLNEVWSNAATDNELCRLFFDAVNVFCRGVNNTYDKKFLDTVKSLYNRHNSGFDNTLKIYIDMYIEEYPDRLENIVPLIKFVKSHSRDKYLIKTINSIKYHL